MTFTGRRRYRLKRSFWGRKTLVLQVEATEIVGIGHHPFRRSFWRDAVLEDLSVHDVPLLPVVI